jgi:hypothetical protein
MLLLDADHLFLLLLCCGISKVAICVQSNNIQLYKSDAVKVFGCLYIYDREIISARARGREICLIIGEDAFV